MRYIFGPVVQEMMSLKSCCVFYFKLWRSFLFGGAEMFWGIIRNMSEISLNLGQIFSILSSCGHFGRR